ncbi:MAG: ribonucleotide reductase N-terminal alpha domain-containing protein [Bacillota bacterium]
MREPQLNPNALKVLQQRYLKKENGQVVETPSDLFHRVAYHVALADQNYGANQSEVEATTKEFYDMMASLEFVPNSPTLMNAGRELGQLSACFVLPVPDTMEGIFSAVGNAAMVHKSGGGTGFDFSDLRPKNASVRSTGGVASGPVSFMRVFNSATEAVKQGGVRRGANMGILRVDHPDIREFITCKRDNADITNFNISVAITEEFMQALAADGEYELRHSGKVYRKERAREVWEMIIEGAWRNGEPGIVFIDRMNEDNPVPHVGKIQSTNPCVTGDTRILTDKGWRLVEELYRSQEPINVGVDGRTLAQDQGHRVVARPAKPVFMTQASAAVYEVTTKRGYTITCTDWHEFYTGRGKLPLKDLHVGDVLYLQSAEGLFGDQGSQDLGYVMGLIAGDGHFTNRGKGQMAAVLTFWGEDQPIAEEALSAVHRLLAPADSTHLPQACPVSERNYTYIRSVQLARLLDGYGFTAETKLKVPEVVWSGTRETVVAYLRGLFTTDGTVASNFRSQTCSVRLNSSSPEFLTEIQVLLANLGIISGHYQRRNARRTVIHGQEYDCRPNYELIIDGSNRERFMEIVGFANASKTERYTQWVKDRILRKHEHYLDPIVSIEHIGDEPVYDTTQPDGNAVIFNGLATGQCGEQPLLANDSCNLGSINLSLMIKDQDGKATIDYDRLEAIVRKSIHFLDNVIEVNQYPLEAIREATLANRKVGLGVMGFADVLFKLNIPYNSSRAVDLADNVMGFIQKTAKDESSRLATIRGNFPNWPGSVFERERVPMRNATVTTIAPTGSISMIAGCSSGIEPIFALAFVKTVMDGTQLVEVNPLFEERAKSMGFYTPELMAELAKTGRASGLAGVPEEIQRVYVTAQEISPEAHIAIQAAFQRHIDNAVSKTINFANDATREDVDRAYWLAYESGCKGLTVYRD